jgi:hypothetical protein
MVAPHGAWILHREFELQAVAPVAGIDSAGARPFLLGPFQRLLDGFGVEETITLDHVQGLRIGRAETINHSMRPELDPHGVDDQRIAFVVADGISVNGWDHRCRMRLVQPRHAQAAIVRVDEGDFVACST